MSAGTAPARSPAAATRVLLLTLVVTVPLVVAPGTSPTRSYPRYVLVVAGAVSLVVVSGAGALFGRRRPAWRNGLHWPVLALVGWSAVCALASDDVGTAVGGFPGSYNGLSTTVAFAVIFFAAASLDPGDGRRLLQVVWFGAGGVVVLYGLVQLAERLVGPAGRGWDLVPPATAPWSISSTLGNPNHLAGFAAMVLPVGAVLWAASTSRAQRRLVAAMAAALGVELAATGSRGGWLGTLAAGATLALLHRADLAAFGRRALRWAVVAVAALVVAAVVLAAAGVAKRDLGEVARVGRGSTLDLRVQLWRTAWSMTLAHPVVGVGPDGFASAFPDHVTDEFAQAFGVFSAATDAHNLFANAAANLGLPGLAALLGLVATAVGRTARAWRRPATTAPGDRLVLGGAAAGLVGYLVQASANTQPVSLSFFAWVLLGLLCVFARPPDLASADSAPAVTRRRPAAVPAVGRR
ncbi:MAG TPA: O-antigen ligase family protein [Acidimicrobiales bacterium]|nr:O-antigen ligase family protein [Acidimicrobiales bacterium]